MYFLRTQTKRSVNRILAPLQAIETKGAPRRAQELQQELENTRRTTRLLKAFNRFLGILIFVALLSIIYDALTHEELPTIPSQPLLAAPQTSPSLNQRPTADVTKSEILLQLVRQRNLFEPAPVEEKAEESLAYEAKTWLQNKFRLIGVIIDKEPKAIIELADGGRTVFVGPGEDLNGARIKLVTKDKVIVLYNGMEVELTR